MQYLCRNNGEIFDPTIQDHFYVLLLLQSGLFRHWCTVAQISDCYDAFWCPVPKVTRALLDVHSESAFANAMTSALNDQLLTVANIFVVTFVHEAFRTQVRSSTLEKWGKSFLEF